MTLTRAGRLTYSDVAKAMIAVPNLDPDVVAKAQTQVNSHAVYRGMEIGATVIAAMPPAAARLAEAYNLSLPGLETQGRQWRVISGS